jgi:hypothetical protein
MSTSNSYSFDLSTSGIIRVAHQRCGIVAAGQDPDSNQYAMGRDFLQIVLTDLQTQGIQLRSILRTTDNLVAGQKQYQAASNVIDIDERTPYVSNASGINLPLEKKSRGQYMALSNPDSQGVPSQIYVEKGETLSYFLYPTPDSQYTTVTYPAVILQPDMVSSANTTGLPTRYLNTVVISLAIALCDHYGQSARKAQLKDDLKDAKESAVNDDTERGPIRFVVEPGIKFPKRW